MSVRRPWWAAVLLVVAIVAGLVLPPRLMPWIFGWDDKHGAAYLVLWLAIVAILFIPVVRVLEFFNEGRLMRSDERDLSSVGGVGDYLLVIHCLQMGGAHPSAIRPLDRVTFAVTETHLVVASQHLTEPLVVSMARLISADFFDAEYIPGAAARPPRLRVVFDGWPLDFTCSPGFAAMQLAEAVGTIRARIQRNPPPLAPAQLPVPAGWYSDPSHRFEWRYWDGVLWTPAVSTNGVRYDDLLS